MTTERFSEPEPNLIKSSSGFTVRVLGRTGLHYSEGDRTVWIDSEVLATPRAIAVHMDSMKVWTSPDGSEEVTEEDRARATSNIERAFTACEYQPHFVPDAATREFIDWYWARKAERRSAEEALDWLRQRGFDVRVEERDLDPQLAAAGYPSAPNASCTHWADLVAIANPAFVLVNYGSGLTRDEAVIRARQRYQTEQGAD